jgi:hypothetical protein
MYERGGGFAVESGFIDLAGTMVRFNTLAEDFSAEPINRLDVEALDALDSGT